MTEGARISELKRPVNPDLIAQLHELLAEAESGELVGAVVLLHIAGGQYRCHCVGESDMGPMMLAFEAWKFRQLAARELFCPSCGHGEDGG